MEAVQDNKGERVGFQYRLPAENGGWVILGDICKAFYQSNYGTYLAHQDYRFTRSDNLTNTEARLYLGVDANPVAHQVTLANHYIPLVIDNEPSPVTGRDISLLRFVAMFHDIGELSHPELSGLGFSPVGDIPSGKKTDPERQQEAAIRRFLWSLPPFTQIDPTFVERAEAIIMHMPLDGDEHLHAIFETAHSLQAFDTARHAGYVAEHSTLPPQLHAQLAHLATRVQQGEMKRLEAIPASKDTLMLARNCIVRSLDRFSLTPR